jgi:hypothetical protein
MRPPRLKHAAARSMTPVMSEVVSIHAARSASTAGEDLNRSGNARDGEAFRIVQRGGRTFHVYGSDEDHKVFELPHGKTPTGSGTPTGGSPAA